MIMTMGTIRSMERILKGMKTMEMTTSPIVDSGVREIQLKENIKRVISHILTRTIA